MTTAPAPLALDVPVMLRVNGRTHRWLWFVEAHLQADREWTRARPRLPTPAHAGRRTMDLVPKWRSRSVVGMGAAALAVAVTAIACPLPHGTADRTEAPFIVENRAAMDKMADGMAITSSGDVDRDFVAMMVPHHQGAIDMAQAELRYGKNEQLRRLAQEIIVTQQQEIVAMRVAVGLPPTSSASSTDARQGPLK